GVVPGDLEIVSELRANGKRTIAVVNKIDVRKAREAALQFYELGIDPLFEVSAEHGMGVSDLLDEIVRQVGGRQRAADPGNALTAADGKTQATEEGRERRRKEISVGTGGRR